MTLEEYLEYKREKSMSQDWVEMIEEETEENRAFELPITIGSKAFENFFGSDKSCLITDPGFDNLKYVVMPLLV